MKTPINARQIQARWAKIEFLAIFCLRGDLPCPTLCRGRDGNISSEMIGMWPQQEPPTLPITARGPSIKTTDIRDSTKVEKPVLNPHALHMDGTHRTQKSLGNAIEIRDSAEFEELVIEGSRSRVVLVDFWANWCDPCHMLAPTLEKIAQDMGDAIALVKVETDAHPDLSSRYQIRSLPTVKIFKDGVEVDYFMGAQPESEIRKVLSAYVTTEADFLVQQAETELAAGNAAQATKLFLAALEKDAGRDQVRLQLAVLLVDEGAFDLAHEVLQPVGDDTRCSAEYKALHAAIELAQQTQTDPAADTGRLLQAIEADPADLSARYQLAMVYLRQQQFQEALDELLEVVKRDRDFNDGAARKTILQVFERLGGAGELVTTYRKHLAQVLL